MTRTPSSLAQICFNLSRRISQLSFNSPFPIRMAARAARQVMRPITNAVGRNHTITASLYGHSLIVPAEHPLDDILAALPQHNRPLASAAQAIAFVGPANAPLSIIDVGANVGETIAVIEEALPGVCFYLCVDADPDIARLCALNFAGNSRVQVKQCYVGEDEGTAVKLLDDGRANLAVKLVASRDGVANAQADRLMRLDTVAASFVEAHGGIDLIKVDTEGYDFSVLRSAAQLIRTYKPALYFEWFPKALKEARQEVCADFAQLAADGYRHYVFFTSQGDYYCHVSDPETLFFEALATKAEAEGSYFDVFAATEKPVCDRLVQLSIGDLLHRAAAKPLRRYLI